MVKAAPKLIPRSWVRVAGFLGTLGVALGAFGAHGLEGRLSLSDLEIFETGVFYHLIHTLAILAASAWSAWDPARRGLQTSCWAFLIGIVLFSGSLYLLAIDEQAGFSARPLVFLTPLGGLCLLVGWASLLLGPQAPDPADVAQHDSHQA